ncbi:MAG: HD-GYP domain-containing protein [Solirubrobacterales bacterium]
MKLELVDRVKPGDILGKSILTFDGKVLLKEGTKLNRLYINKIKAMGVFYIYVLDSKLTDVQISDNSLEELKQSAMNCVSNVMKNTPMMKDRKKSLDVIKIIEELIKYISENGDINKSLYEIQTQSNQRYVHSMEVCVRSIFLGKELGLRHEQLNELGLAALLHDIGMTKIPLNILEKHGKYTHEEQLLIKEHPKMGYEILKQNMRISEPVLNGVLQHHERVDGKGYPNGLYGSQICKYAKIISVCDMYDLVTNNDNYKKTFRPHDAYELIIGGSSCIFDEQVVMAFKRIFSVYPLGCCVKLSNEIEGYVVRQNEYFPDRPVLRVIYDKDTKEPVAPYEIDLIKDINVVIKCII